MFLIIEKKNEIKKESIMKINDDVNNMFFNKVSSCGD
jgi:hypothetical protein